MNEAVYIGIDPGAEGAMAVLFDDRTWLLDAPVIRQDGRARPDVPLMLTDIHRVKAAASAACIVAIEVPVPLRNWARNGADQSPCPRCGQRPGGEVRGTIANAQLNKLVGLWAGLFAALDCEVIEVRPHVWKGALLRGMPDTGKESAMKLAVMMHPEVGQYLKRKKDNNRAEALLIAEWCKLNGRRILASRATPKSEGQLPLVAVQEAF